MLADIPTLFLAAISTTLVLAATLVAISRHRGMTGIRIWGYALTLHAGTYVLLTLRGSIPDAVSIIGANTLEAMFVALWVTVIATFQRRTVWAAVVYAPVVLTALVYGYFLDDLRMRLLFGNPVLLFQLLTAIYLLRTTDGVRQSVGQRLLSLSLLATVLVLSIRLLAVLTSTEQIATLTTQSMLQTLVYLTGSIIPLMASLGFLVMTKERADSLVEEGKQTLMAIFDSVEESILLTRRDGTLLQINRIGAARLGGVPQDMVGTNVFQILPTVVAQPRLDALARVALTRKAEHLTDQRAGRHYRLSMYPVEGGLDRFVTTGTDVTDEVAALAMLRHSEAHFRAFFERSMFGMATTSASKEWLTVNDALCHLVGYSRDELIASTWDSITHPDDLGVNVAAFDRVIAGESDEYTLDKRFIRKDGQLVFTHIASRCLRLDDGSIDYFVVLFEDVTDRKAREAELSFRMQELTNINHQLKSAQGQLLQSEKMAAVGQLAAGVAHEINNPIGFVSSNLNTLRKYTLEILDVATADLRVAATLEPEHPLRLQIEKIHNDAEVAFLQQDITDLLRESSEGLTRVKKIVTDLKDFSHVDEAEWQEVDLNRGLESTLNVAWNELKYKARVVREFGDIPLVRCIPAQMNQVFLNLLINAGQAIEESGTITLRTGHENSHVWVEIEDTGKGIPADIKARIFEPFFTTKPVGKGTGLGLSISWDIVQRHHGSIQADSQIGKGTVFRISLPTSTSAAVPAV
jgi:PAS domain S-box-containing protein